MPTEERPSLTLERHLKAPIEKVFKAWTSGEALKRWFGPGQNLSVPVADVDFRVGGRYRIVMREPGGEEHRVGGVYREIVPPTRLVFSWAWESTPDRESLVTVSLTEKDGGTQLTLRHERFADAPARDRHQSGWAGTLDRLERFLG
jgi:uncharacterized protein YndB with AHSA1/START domain